MKKIFQIIILLFTISTIWPTNNYSFAKNSDNQKITISNKNEISKVNENKKDKNNLKKDMIISTNKNINSKATVNPQKTYNKKNSSKNNQESKNDLDKKEIDYSKNKSKIEQSQPNNNSNKSLKSSSSDFEIAQKEMTPSDWKISVDDNKKNSDFDFIHNSNPTANPLNDGHLLLILGISLIILSIIGLIAFSLLLIKNKKQN